MKSILFLLALLPAAEPQDRRPVASREFTITIWTSERVAARTLWVSRDGGKTWKTAKDAAVVETWGEWANGAIKCGVRVPEDGAYDLHASLGDAVGNPGADPRPGEAARPFLRFDVREETPLSWISPRAGEELIGGNQVLFKWSCDKKGLKEKSLQVYAQVDGQPWKAVESGLELTGQSSWVLPATAAPVKIRFRLSAFTPDDREVASREIEGTLVPGRTVVSLVWDQPKGSLEWTGGATVTLKWSSLGAEFRERSAELLYAVDEEPWTPVTRGLEATGTYLWAVPNRETSRLRLRVRALTRSGQEAAAVSDPVAVRVTVRPNLAQARALYDRARVLAAQQRYGEALLKYEEALAAWSEFGEVLNDLGKLYAEQKEPTRALEYFLRARKTSPSNPIPYVNAAMMEARLGLHEDALADLQDAVTLGLERDERTAVLAAETLWKIAAAAIKAEQRDRAGRACELILKVRQASGPTRAKARETLAWLREKP
jgi:Tfp pilus assembly protein PilF